MCLPQQLSLALQTLQQLDLLVHVHDLILQVLAGDIYLLAQLRKHTGQLSGNNSSDTNTCEKMNVFRSLFHISEVTVCVVS